MFNNLKYFAVWNNHDHRHHFRHYRHCGRWQRGWTFVERSRPQRHPQDLGPGQKRRKCSSPDPFPLHQGSPRIPKDVQQIRQCSSALAVDQRQLLGPGLHHFGRFERRHQIPVQPGVDGQSTKRSRRRPSAPWCYSYHVRGVSNQR
jgi:hypothetical protein